MFSGEAIERILDAETPKIQEINGVQFCVSKANGAQALKYPDRPTLTVFSLTQILLYIKENGLKDCFVNVFSPTTVQLITKSVNLNGRHEIIAVADFSHVYEPFQSGRQLDQEDFIIALMSKFHANFDRNDLVIFAQKCKAGKIRTSQDNGISQVVKTSTGVSLVTDQELKSIWMLEPFKSFPEIMPVEIKFLLRLHQNGEELPNFSLTECDGGKWKVESVKLIRDFCIQWIENAGDKIDRSVSVI